MAIVVDIDGQSGFCGGVIRAIGKAEEILNDTGKLYSLGAIVHNESELHRLGDKGLVTIASLGDLSEHPGESVLVRAHGEPPKTYEEARKLNLHLVDATCPVVLKLQREIRDTYQRQCKAGYGQILIFGKTGHAEVLGLVGQTEGHAVVVQDLAMLREVIAAKGIRLDESIEVFSQTTKSPDEYRELCEFLKAQMTLENGLSVHETICSQVATRHENLVDFAVHHDVIIFVSGRDSSNGKVLFDLCRSNNIRTYHITSPDDIADNWFRDDDMVGVCGATSTPKWLLVQVADRIQQLH